MRMTPAVSGFFKQILMVIIIAVAGYLADQAHLTGLLPLGVGVIVSSIASAVESAMKASSGGTTALFGAVKIK